MFRFLTLFVLAFAGLFFCAPTADAGIFGPRVRVQNFGGGGVNVQARGGFFGPRINVQNFGGGGFQNLQINNRGFFNRGANINIQNVGGARVAFVPTGFGNNFAFVRGAAVSPFGFNSLAFGGNNFAVNNIGLRFNAFGTRTVTDSGGNIFETDSFGNSVFRGNLFSRGFGGNAFIGANSFGGFNSFGFNSFSSGGCH